MAGDNTAMCPTTDNVLAREAFEHWYSDEGASPEAVRRSGDGYVAMQANLSWIVWQAAWVAALRASTGGGEESGCLGAILATLRERYEAGETVVGVTWVIARLEELERQRHSFEKGPPITTTDNVLARVTDEMVTAAMREFEKWTPLLRYREAEKWHLNDIQGMRHALAAALRASAVGEKELEDALIDEKESADYWREQATTVAERLAALTTPPSHGSREEWRVEQNAYGASFLYAGSRFLCGGTEPVCMTKEDMELIADTMNASLSSSTGSAPSGEEWVSVPKSLVDEVIEIRADLREFDGDRRGHIFALQEAEDAVIAAAVNAAAPAKE